ncbi:solute carrier family 22 member 23-like [Brienomyrus brachyistius]|uniref:solute carrier family 22 member 23-like n=1 Tax=Brienomyrus brachyistius TaxID=42636 RepID=UPI0020B25E6A|nr:solute carrier family 22 member 23-like [Brienomyrus brachyistius]
MAVERLEMGDRQPENGFVSCEAASPGFLSSVDNKVLPNLGGFGKYQKQLVVLTWIPALFIGFSQFSDYFLLAQPNITCLDPSANASNFTGGPALFDSNGSLLSRYSFGNGTLQDNSSIPCECKDRRYKLEMGLDRNVVTKWNLVCDNASMVHIAKFTLLVGSIIGYLVMGVLADWFGRHPVLVISVLFMLVFGLSVAFSVDETMFSTLRVFEGFCLAGINLSLYVLRIELCLPRYRFSVTMVASFITLAGQLLMPGLAVLCKDWHVLQVLIVCPLVLMLLYTWLFQESLRWLLATKQYSKSKGLMSKMAKKNEVELEDRYGDILTVLHRAVPNKPQKTCIVKMVGTRNLWKNIVVLCVNSLTGYGIHHCFARSMRDPESNETPLFQNFYQDYYTMAGIATAACIALCPVVGLLGRRGGLLVFMIITALASLLQLGLPNLLGKYSDHLKIERSDTLNRNFSIAFSVIGMFSSHAISNLSIFFCAEVTPTAIRGGGLGLVLASAGVGMLAAPIMELHNQKGYFLHHIIFACCTLICIICILLLPETRKQPLPEAIADGENYARQPLLPPRRAGEQHHLLSRSQSREYTPLHQMNISAAPRPASADDFAEDTDTPPPTDSAAPLVVNSTRPSATDPPATDSAAPLGTPDSPAPPTTDLTTVLVTASAERSSPVATDAVPPTTDSTSCLTTDSPTTPTRGPIPPPLTDVTAPVLADSALTPKTDFRLSIADTMTPPATDSISPSDATSCPVADLVMSPNVRPPSPLAPSGCVAPPANGAGPSSPAKDSPDPLVSDSIALSIKDPATYSPAKESITYPDGDSPSTPAGSNSSPGPYATGCTVAPAIDIISPSIKDTTEPPVTDIATKETSTANGVRSS